MEDEERQRKLAAGKAKLARFRQRKAQCDGDIPKKQKKKRTSGSKPDSSSHTHQQSDEICSESSQRVQSAGNPDSSRAEITKHGQVFSAEPESEISTTADECSSEEEDFSIDDSYSEQGAQSSQTCLQMVENELAEKQHDIEELTQELEEMRASFGTEGLKQLQEFEAAIKQRDGIITQLTANLQQARKEKDDTMIEFLELTEQSQKLQIQFQHLQANETLQNSTLSRTATDLLQAKRQVFTQQQQLQDYQKKEEDFQTQISVLQEKIRVFEMEKDRKVENLNTKEIQEKQAIIDELNTRVLEEEKKTVELKNKVTTADELLGQLQEQVTEKDQEIKSLKLELVNSQQNERKCSEEIKELMRTVEELQKRNLKDSQLETGTVRRMEQETQRKLSHLQAELDEMYGKQIVQMKQELIKQHMSQIEELKSQHKREMENTFKSDADTTVSKEQVNLMNAAINELNGRLQDTHAQKEKLKGELEVVLGENSALQSQSKDLLEEIRFLREQVQKARQTIAEQENRLSDARRSLSTVEDLKAEIVAASESRKELEVKHEAEITNYKIKLEMLEKEKNAVLDRMAESQEAELERLRTQLLFSHEEELSKLKEDLEVEHRINIEKLKDNLGIHYKQQIDGLQNEMNRKMESMQFETDNLITQQNQLILENSKLRDLQEYLVNSKSEEMNLQINELQKEIEILRQEGKEKGTLEQEVQELQLKTEQLEKQLKEKEDDLQEKCAQLDAENSLLKDEKKVLEDMLKMYTPLDQEERLIAVDPSTGKSEEDSKWQKEVEMLRKENEDLKQQCLHLNEEIEKQKNTFAFAEKNFEVNYQELQREYSSLLKIRDDLEDTQTKQALEYESKLRALEEELRSQRGRPAVPEGRSSAFATNKAFPSEPLEVGEVVEKDTTELMEKLEVTKREKLELSEKVSGLSEQLKQTHGMIESLSAEVRTLMQEKEQLLLRCGELELLTNPDGTDKAAGCPAQTSSYQPGLVMGPVGESQGYVSKISEDLAGESKPMIEEKIPFKGSGREQLLLSTRTKKPSRAAVEPCESEKLQQELHALKAEQDDLRLQMEAQRICLLVVYSAHADQVRAHMEKEREEALCSLKDRLVSAQQEKIEELHRIHQCQLQNVKIQETGNWHLTNFHETSDEPLQALIEQLQKAVSEKCFHISKALNSVFDECYTPLKCEMNIEEKENSGVYTSQNQSPELQEYRYEVQDFQENMQILLGKVTEECSKVLVLQTRLSKLHEQQTDGVTLEFAEENVTELEAGLPSGRAQSAVQSTDVSQESKLSSLPAREKSRECERQVQELQSLVAAGQLQLKETEANHRAEVQRLQKRLQAVSEAVAQPSLSIDSVVFKGSGAQKPGYCESCLRERVDGTAEFSDGFEVKQETNMVKLMEKQYQERLEEEIAKVIVSMSIAFAQQTELSRLSEGKENAIQSEQAHTLCSQNDITAQCQVGLQTLEATDKNFKEEFKPLSKELGESSKAVPPSNHDGPDDALKSEEHGLTISEEIFSKDETFIVRKSIPEEVLVSNMDTCGQLILNEQLEDMRQELVRQYEEHQQATEMLRQAHMQQMERQREDQEQLQEEIKRLHEQLTQKSSIDTEHVVSERERVLLEELEALKQLSLAGRKELCCELRDSSVQTQDGNDNQEVEEQTLKDKTLERKPEDVPLDINLSNERYALKKANNRLLKILLDVVKTTSAAEETIGRHVLGILDRSSKGQPATSLLWRSEAEASAATCVQEECARAMDESIPSYPGTAIATQDSVWSEVAEEGAELSQRLVRSGFAGPVIDPENEELMLNISSRLQAAVEKLLEAISETNSQLEHAKVTQTELMRESFRQKQEATESRHCLEDLRERLQEESRAREQLAVELSKAESVIDGYSDEKTLFERQIQEKTDMIEHLEQELLCMNNRLQELESDQRRMEEERELLSRQREAMRAEAGPAEQQFLQETEKLMKEKLEVQCQAEKVRGDLQKQVKALEIDVEEQVSRFIELEQEKNAELTDLRQQSHALEKQLEKMRKFLDEQAIDREHERDVFQQEIQKLEHQLKVVPRFQPVSEHQTREVEQLTNHLKEKTDKCSELLLSKEQLQRDVQERNEEIEKLECRVRELEQALLATADPFPKVEDQKRSGAIEVEPELSLEVQLQAERDATDRKQKEITNLEEQLEQFREELENKNEEVQELLMQLEIQKKESTTRLQELQQENRLFKDEIEKLVFAMKESDSVSTQDQPMLFGKFAQLIQEKEIEIDRLNEQFIKLQQQLKLTADNKVIEEQKEQIRALETKVECLMSDQEHVKKQREEEVEQLNGVIEKLQQELVSIEQKREDAETPPEDEESVKHQLDKVTVEKLGLEQQVETTNQEMTYMKNVLKEINFKMDQITQSLCNLNKECASNKELPSVPKGSVHVTVHELDSDKLQPEDAPAQDASKPLENQTSLMCLQESTKDSRILEIKSLPPERPISTKDFELTQCHKEIETIQEQDQSEVEMLQKKITDLQTLLEKLTATLVSQVHTEAARECVQFCQERQMVSSASERTDAQNVNRLTENNMETDVPTLAVRLAELESQVAEVHSGIMSEKHVENAEKNASETEKKVVALPKLLEEAKKRLREEGEGSPWDEEKTVMLTHGSGDSGFSGGLEAESVTTSELDSYKKRAEKLEEDLLVKESYIASLQKDLDQVTDQLIEAKEKLSHFLENENRTGEQESRKVPTPEPPSVEVGACSGPTERTGKLSSSSQTSQVPVRNAGIQIDLQSECSQEEVRDTINQFTKKMEHIQELHAAEILDMESRHISETESLKKEHSVVIQLLTKECETLKQMTQCPRCKEGSSIPELADSVAYQSREVYSSDSESDWGQSQGFDTALEGREEGETSADLFPKKIKGLMKAVHSEGMQVLSLSNPLCDDGEDHSTQQLSESWLKERQAYLNTISSLKDLISKMQVQRETEVCDCCQSCDSFSDWRGELLLACQRVFVKERSVLLATFQTELTSLSARGVDGLLNSLEQRIQDQDIEYQTAMDCLQKADRRSLLAEIEDLRAQINGRKMTLEREEESKKASQELLDCSMQQKQSHVLELQLELSSLRDRAAELQEQLSSEKMVVAELKSELAQAKLELGTTLKAQHKRLKELEAFRSEIKEKTDEIHFLSDTLAREQKKSLELQWALEKEKAKSGHHEEWEKEELEDLKFSLEDQKQRNTQLNLLLEQQKQLLNESQQKIESQKMLHDAQLSEEQGRNLGLQALLESEQVRVQEMKSTLDKERELYAQLQNREDGAQPPPVLPSEDLLKELQKQLEEKHSRIVELLSETEKYKLDSLQTRQQMEKDRQVHQKTLQTEQEANTQGQKKMQELQCKVEELQRQLQEKRQQVYRLDLEGKRLQGIMQEFQKQELEPEEKRGSRGLVHHNLNEPAAWNFTDDRTRNWVLQQKMGETKDANFTKLIEVNGGELDHNHDLEMVRQTLQHVASKLQHVAQKACSRLQFETASDDEFIWIQENIDGIILQLQKLTGQPGDEHSLGPPSSSCGSLTESLMKQNTELTRLINQLTEEKNTLRSIVIKLEELNRCYWHPGAGRDCCSRFSFIDPADIEAIIASEKEVWNREKLSLQKALKRAEAKVYKLKADLRNDALLRNLSPDSEHAALQKIYNKYLRASSFRKALIYQKKYLLLLLGGFQECEDVTLGVLARMGGHLALKDPKTITGHPKGFTRFRSAVRVSIAISRMKFLVRRWQQVTSTSSININRDGFGLSPGMEKTDPFYHSPGGLELYGEPRHTTYRSRFDLDYPRSPLPLQNRYPGTPGDLNSISMASSQLHQYNPDKSLTDYVTRLEALKRRLGAIQSGSTTQFHFGMRR